MIKILLSVFLVASIVVLITSKTSLLLGIRSFVVVTGSMQPAIPVGAVVFVAPAGFYNAGDVVAFKNKNEVIVTHRIVEKVEEGGSLKFKLKGDANNSSDTDLITDKSIIGREIFAIPVVGKLSQLLRTLSGFIALIILPTLVFVGFEFMSIKREIEKEVRSKNTAILTLLVVAFIYFSFQASHAFYSDSSTSSGNVFIAATFTPSPVPPSPTPTISLANHIVINEIYYDVCTPASTCGNDPQNEWIELYNPTNNSVVLTNWTLEDNTSSDTLPSGTTIPAGGFLVITPETHTFDIWSSVLESQKVILGSNIGNGLANQGDRIILKDNTATIIDAVSYGTDTTQLNPAAIDVVSGHSLERDPDGLDTDTASDFVDRSTPQPGI